MERLRQRLRQSSVWFVLLTCFVAFSLPNTAQASTVVYSDQASWALNVASGDYLQDFTGLSGTLGNNIGFPQPPVTSPFSYSVATLDPTSGLFGDEGLSTQSGIDIILVTFTGAPVTAVGGHFFSNASGLITVGVSINDPTITPYGAMTFTTMSFGTPSFAGFTNYGGLAFTTLEVFSNGGGFPTITNLDVGTAIPEPGTFGLLAGALVGLGLLGKRWIK